VDFGYKSGFIAHAAEHGIDAEHQRAGSTRISGRADGSLNARSGGLYYIAGWPATTKQIPNTPDRWSLVDDRQHEPAAHSRNHPSLANQLHQVRHSSRNVSGTPTQRASRSAVWWFAVGCLEWCLFADATVWWFCVAGGRHHAAAGALAWVGMRI